MEGQRVAKGSDGGHKGLLIAGIIIGVLAVVYLGLCTWLNISGLIMPNVRVAGVDVSGMTAQEAQLLLNEEVAQYEGAASVTLTYGSWNGTLTAEEFPMTSKDMGGAAAQVGRDHFLLQGANYLRHLFGHSVSVGREEWNASFDKQSAALKERLEEVEQLEGAEVAQMSWSVYEEQLVVQKGVTGVAFDRDRIYQLTCDAVLESIETAVKEKSEASVVVDLMANGAVTETKPDDPDFDALHRELYAEAKNAEVLPGTLEVTEHTVGVDFGVKELKAAYDQAPKGELIRVPLIITQPEETKEGLEAKLFADLLGQATSRVGGTKERKFNVRLSAEACNGVVLMPGEEFSYNNTTGSRTEDKGYQPAPVYIGGKSEDEVGGGICQTSSTIYYAVLHTTLEIVERVNHRYAVGYVPDGMDATVYYGATDFRFKNNTNYPIKIVTESYDENGSRKLRVKIYGTNEDGRYAIPERVQSDWIEPTVSYMADEEVPRGTLVLDTKQNAYTGVTAQVYRHVYEKDGTFVETQNMGVSKYKMRPHLYHYNPLDGDPATWVDGKPPVPQEEKPAVEPVAPAPAPEPVQPETPPAETPVSQDVPA